MDRDALLERIAGRLRRRRGAPVPPVPCLRSQTVRAEKDGDFLVRRFVERLRDLGGEAAVVADRAEAQAAVARLLAERHPGSLACPPALRWPEIEALCGGDLATAAFGLSEPRWAIAETGTVVLWHDGGSPRATSLLPPAVGFLLPASR
ncbi:MAG: LUD domain-containing protein, partial [Actinobacteria bacterium]|nr:LUD domain-containing protein [Actinomycetota bacterium]